MPHSCRIAILPAALFLLCFLHSQLPLRAQDQSQPANESVASVSTSNDPATLRDSAESKNRLFDGLTVFLPFDVHTGNAIPGGPNTTPGPVAPSLADSGHRGKCLHFEKQGEILSLGPLSDSALKDASGFSVAFWFRSNETQQGDPVFLSNKAWTNGMHSGFALVANMIFSASATEKQGTRLALNLSDSKKRTDLSPLVWNPNGQWFFVAMTVEQKGLASIWLGQNGESLTSSSSSWEGQTWETPLPWNIGNDGTGHYTDYNTVLKGDIDDFALWNRPLSPEELDTVYRQGLGETTCWQLSRQTPSQMMGYIFRTPNNKIIVLDGGTPGDADSLAETVQILSGHNHVDAWFLTHLHLDHYGAVRSLFQDKPETLTVDSLYYAFPKEEIIRQYDAVDQGNAIKTALFLSGLPCSHHVVQGNQMAIDGLTVTVLNDPLNVFTNNLNDTGVAYRFETNETTFLFPGDLGVSGGDHLFASQDIKTLQCDFTQMSHHGQRGFSREQYEKIKPVRCLWPTPDWLWENRGKDGPGTGPFETLQTRQWMDELGAREHYISKDGPLELIVP